MLSLLSHGRECARAVAGAMSEVRRERGSWTRKKRVIPCLFRTMNIMNI